MIERAPIKRLPGALLAGASALLLTAALMVLLSHFRVLAEPVERPDIQKYANTTKAGPGDVVTYSIYARRVEPGPGIPDAWITDTLPSELINVSVLTASFGTFGFGNGVITWTTGSTDTLGAVWITYTAQVSPGIGSAILTNTAVVNGAGEVDTSTVEVEVEPAKLEASKSVAPSTIRKGEQVAYTILITNIGYGGVTAVMTDDLPLEVRYAGGFTATTGGGAAAGDVVTWTGSLGALEAVTITFAAEVTSALSGETLFTNTAWITGAGNLVTAAVGARAIITDYTYWPIFFYNYPPIPILNPIPFPDENGSYVVSWELDSPYVDKYVLQESASPSFSPVTGQWEVTHTSHSTLVEGGLSRGYTLYYRVRADDGWGEGPWSNVQSAVLGYYDDFSDDDSGWPEDKGKMYYDDDEYKWKYWRRGYKSSHYRFYIDQGGAFSWFYQPDALAPFKPPTDKYCVETTLRYEKRGYWANMGLIFGANNGNSKLYAVCTSYASGEVSWFVMKNDDYDFPKKACFGKKYASGKQGTSVSGWNRIQVSVDGNNVDVYVGGEHVYQDSLSGLREMKKVGLLGGVYEVTPVDIRADYFKVIVNAPCK